MTYTVPAAQALAEAEAEAGAEADRGRRLRTALVVLVPAAVALALSFYDLGTRSIWLDESATISIANQHGAALWSAMQRDGGNMLAFYGLVHVLFSWFGDGTVVLRAPAAVASGLTAAAVAATGARLFRPAVGLAAGLLTAVSLPFVYWSQNGRAYSLVVAFGALSYLGFVHLVAGESRRRPGHPPWYAPYLYAGSLIVAVYMSFIVVLLVPAQLLSLYWYRRRGRVITTCLAVVAVASVPVLLLAHARGSSQIFWIRKPNLNSTFQIVQVIVGSGLPPEFRHTASSVPLLAITLALGVGAGVLGLWRARRHPPVDGVSQMRWAGALVAGWLVVPLALDVAESSLGQSIYESRYLLMSSPALALLLAWALLSPRRRTAPKGRAMLAGGWVAVVALLVLRGVQILPTYTSSPENWQEATRYVLARERPGDCVLFYPSDVRQAFDYYVLHSSFPESSWPRPILPTAPFTEVRAYLEDYATLSSSQLTRRAASCPRMWFVSSHAGVPGASLISTTHHLRYVALLRGLESDYARHRLVRISHASQIDVWLFAQHR